MNQSRLFEKYNYKSFANRPKYMFREWSFHLLMSKSVAILAQAIMRVPLERVFLLLVLSVTLFARMERVSRMGPEPTLNHDEWFASLRDEVRCFDPFYLELWTFEGKSYIEPGSGRVNRPPKVEGRTRGGKLVRLVTRTL